MNARTLAWTACLLGGLFLPAFAQDGDPQPAGEEQAPSSGDAALDADFQKIMADFQKMRGEEDEAARNQMLDGLYDQTRKFLDTYGEKLKGEQLTVPAAIWLQIAHMKENFDGVEKEIAALRARKEALPEDLAGFLGQLEGQLKIRPGMEAPGWTAKDVHTGEEVTLASFKGKLVLVDYWATWCPPCRSLMQQHLKPLHDGYAGKEKEFALVGLGLGWNGDTAQMQKEFGEKHGYKWQKVYDESGKSAEAYSVDGIPFLVLVDPEGKILVAGSGWQVIDKVKKVLEEKLGPPAQVEGAAPEKKDPGEKK